MNRVAPFVSAWLFLSLGVTGRASDPPTVPITQVDVSRFPEVTVFFKPVGVNGRPLPSIVQNQVEIFEDEIAVGVTRFQGYGSFKVHTVLLIDTSGSMSEGVRGRTKLEAARDAGRAFIHVCRPGDEAAILRFDTRVHVLHRLSEVTPDTARSLDQLVAAGNTSWRDAVADALHLIGPLTGRRNVILLTDGQDNSSGQSVKQVMELARKYQVPIHAIGLGEAAGIDEHEMRGLAQETGGQYLCMPNADRLAEFYTKLGSAIQEETSVTYISRRPTPDGTRRRIRLVIQTPDGIVGGASEYLERHLLNIQSHLGIFAFFALILCLMYSAPAARNWWSFRPWRLAEIEAQKDSPTPTSTPPTLLLNAALHPAAVPVDCVMRSVTCRLDVSVLAPDGVLPRCQPLALAVLLDLSASMEGDRLEAARTALQSLLAGLDDDDTFCLIGFHATSQVIVPFSRVGRIRPLFAERFASLQMGTSTALAPALTLLAAAFTPIQSVARRRLSAVIVSDGKVEDAVQAAAARSLLPANLTIAALGIGTDYDHNLLAHICGNTRMVDHLDNPVQAIEAFNRYVTLYGHTLTANTRLHFRPATGVLVNEVTAVRHVRTIPLKDGVAAIDDLPAHGKASYLVKFLMTPASTGLHALAGITLKYDLPGHALSDLRFDVSITIEVTTDPVMANATNPDVMQAIRLVMAGKMVESAELHIEKGDSVQAKATLRQATRRYQEAGALQQADDVARFLDALPKVADEDQLTKSARGLTKRVTE